MQVYKRTVQGLTWVDAIFFEIQPGLHLIHVHHFWRMLADLRSSPLLFPWNISRTLYVWSWVFWPYSSTVAVAYIPLSYSYHFSCIFLCVCVHVSVHVYVNVCVHVEYSCSCRCACECIRKSEINFECLPQLLSLYFSLSQGLTDAEVYQIQLQRLD